MAALALALGSAFAAAQGSIEVARALLDEARQAAGIGDWASAADCLSEASLQDPGDADILYLASLASIKRAMPLADSLGKLNAALSTGRFTYYSKSDASLLKAELLVRERRWKEALDALGPPGSESAADPAYRLIRARAFSGMGDKNAYTAELREALRRFPDDPAFARLFLSRAGSIPSPAEARELGDIILSRLTRYSLVDSELPVLAAPLMASISAKRDAVLAYRATGGSSAAATLRALEYGLIDETAASAELLSGLRPLALNDISSLFALAGSPSGRDAVLSALSAWSGEVEVDSDSDGIAEGIFSLSKGLVTGWKLDSNQEGEYKDRASFIDGLPTTLVLMREGLEIDVQYFDYPAVASVAFVEKGEKRGYSFAPEALSFSPLAMRPFAGSGRSALFFPASNPVPDPSERSCAAAALSVTVDSGSSRKVTLLDKGIALSATSYKGGILFSTTSYDRGQPALERVDTDGDGRFETERGYITGADGTSVIAWFRTDADGDGVFEYCEQTVFPFRKEWDYDGNGSVDALQFQLTDGSIEEEFSSRLDGRLDETMIVKSGRIISLSREGAALALQPDSNPQLTWIGKKSFNLGRNLPLGEGIFYYMGKRYRLTRLGDRAFAEIIP
jgi:hypothetical protein